MSDKGQEFERGECRFLSLWWTNQEKDDIFWRNRLKVTSKTSHAEKQLGDITATHTIGLPFIEMFNVELKAGYSKTTTKQAKKILAERNRERIAKGKEPVLTAIRNTPWDLLEIIDSKQIDDNLAILQFWDQCETDALISDRIPLLIFKRDFHEPVVCVCLATFTEILQYSGWPLTRRILFCPGADNNKSNLMLYRHSDFFEWLDPDVIRTIHKQKIREEKVNLGSLDTNIYRKRI